MTRSDKTEEAASIYESVALEPYRSVKESFIAGARWADMHNGPTWINIKDRLPEPHKKVLVYGYFTLACSTAIEVVAGCELNRRFTQLDQKRMGRSAHGMFDKYGFPNHGNPKYEGRYWIPIPGFQEEGGTK